MLREHLAACSQTLKNLSSVISNLASLHVDPSFSRTLLVEEHPFVRIVWDFTSSTMHLRPMHLGDLPDLADLSAEAQFEDELTDFIVPYRRDYYTSYRNSFLRRMRARRLRPGWIYWVAETDEGDEPTTMQKQKGEKELGGRVIGYAAWLREGQSPVARNWQKINEEWFISE